MERLRVRTYGYILAYFEIVNLVCFVYVVVSLVFGCVSVLVIFQLWFFSFVLQIVIRSSRDFRVWRGLAFISQREVETRDGGMRGRGSVCFLGGFYFRFGVYSVGWILFYILIFINFCFQLDFLYLGIRVQGYSFFQAFFVVGGEVV